MRAALSAVLLASLGTAAGAQDAPQPAHAEPLRIVIPVVEPGCDGPKPDDDAILVCGSEDRRYRLDPAVLAVSRTRDARGTPPEAHERLFQEKCSPVGGHVCPGQDVVPISNIALVAASAAVKAAKGEDLRPMLRTGPDEYEVYKRAKAAAEAEAEASE